MKKLTLFLLASGLALTTLQQLGRRRRHSELRRQDAAELHRWEDEGGNLPPQSGAAPSADAPARDPHGV